MFADGETWESRSEPRTHDLQFYLSYHAVMTVAGELLATHPTHHDPNNPSRGFDHWLARSALSRSDGRWLADRRDPVPLERPNWKNKEMDAVWQWAICRSDFDNLLVFPDQRVNVWGIRYAPECVAFRTTPYRPTASGVGFELIDCHGGVPEFKQVFSVSCDRVTSTHRFCFAGSGSSRTDPCRAGPAHSGRASSLIHS
jgi:hypothetical protein